MTFPNVGAEDSFFTFMVQSLRSLNHLVDSVNAFDTDKLLLCNLETIWMIKD